jgi:4-hydroxyproline epimerase
MQRIEIVDSHTEGEPTRTVVAGWPELRGATLAERCDDARARFDRLRTAIVTEPRATTRSSARSSRRRSAPAPSRA